MHTTYAKRRCYLRTHRRNWGLTQKELAELIGTVRAAQVSRYETDKRAPKLEVALACQVIFGVPPATMFPDTFTLIEEEVIRNMHRMDQRLAHTTNPIGMRKRELCGLALERAVQRTNSHDAV